MITTINPYTLKSISNFRTLPESELDEKLIQANKSFESWRMTTFQTRSVLMKELGAILRKRAYEIAPTITGEMGKPLSQSVAEIEKCAWVCDYYAENAESFLKDIVIQSSASKSWVRYDPLGIILGIMPWNYPFWQVMRFAVPTIMAGNAVMVKHSPTTMGSAQLIHELFIQAGFPEYLYTNLIIEVEQAEYVIKHPLIKAVTLTGSEKAGSAVASVAAKHIKKSVLELGGSNAFIVLNDASIEEAVNLGIEGRMQNNGQSCIAAKRFLIHEEIAETYINQFVEKLKTFRFGDPLDKSVSLGPLAREDLAEKLEGQVQESIRQGAQLLIGGSREGAYFEPTVLTNVKPGMIAFEEELFGPVAAFTTFNDLEQAIQLSNHNNFGLGVTFCTQDPSKLDEYLYLIEDGAIFLNEKVMSDPRLPFGGTKNSGFGRELGGEGILEFVNMKSVYLK